LDGELAKDAEKTKMKVNTLPRKRPVYEKMFVKAAELINATMTVMGTKCSRTSRIKRDSSDQML